ncbi:TPA: histidine kinase [Candidatus Uhrbacteria bacterium]|nr:histidine kinase [Candidatus Uhrbacteria bacterium]
MKNGTKVFFMISLKEKRHLNDLFRKYSGTMSDEGYGFDKTEIRVRLYTLGGVHISRSQARRVLSGLEKFKIVIMDYSDVPMIGQAFVDEIYRVFKHKHPDICIENEHMNEAVRFMIERAIHEAKK